jgi:hypothetical protein
MSVAQTKNGHWHEGMGLGFAAPIRFETESFQKKGFIN